MRALIIEDEELASDRLLMLLKERDEHIEVKAVLDSVKRSVQWLMVNEVDLIFMDIHLSDDISFKIFEEVEVQAPVIFTTAYDEYAIRAFDQNSLGYLLKPIDREALDRAITKYHRYAGKGSGLSDSIKSLLASYEAKETSSFKKRIMVNYGGKMQTIPISQVAVFYVHERAVFLKTLEGKKYIVDDSLEKIESWTRPEEFFRVNRKFLINIESVTEVLQYSARKLKVNLHVETPDLVLVPTEKITPFKKWLAS